MRTRAHGVAWLMRVEHGGRAFQIAHCAWHVAGSQCVEAELTQTDRMVLAGLQTGLFDERDRLRDQPVRFGRLAPLRERQTTFRQRTHVALAARPVNRSRQDQRLAFERRGRVDQAQIVLQACHDTQQLEAGRRRELLVSQQAFAAAQQQVARGRALHCLAVADLRGVEHAEQEVLDRGRVGRLQASQRRLLAGDAGLPERCHDAASDRHRHDRASRDADRVPLHELRREVAPCRSLRAD